MRPSMPDSIAKADHTPVSCSKGASESEDNGHANNESNCGQVGAPTIVHSRIRRNTSSTPRKIPIVTLLTFFNSWIARRTTEGFYGSLGTGSLRYGGAVQSVSPSDFVSFRAEQGGRRNFGACCWASSLHFTSRDHDDDDCCLCGLRRAIDWKGAQRGAGFAQQELAAGTAR